MARAKLRHLRLLFGAVRLFVSGTTSGVQRPVLSQGGLPSRVLRIRIVRTSVKMSRNTPNKKRTFLTAKLLCHLQPVGSEQMST